MGCRCPHRLHRLELSRSSMYSSVFPARTHLYANIWTNWYRPQSLYTARCSDFWCSVCSLVTICRSRQVSYHNSAFNQFVGYEMTCFVQTVFALVALPFRDTLIDLAQMDIASRLLFAAVPSGADFV